MLGAAALGVSLASPIWLAPYTKVEESFTLQAVHDILTFGIGAGVAQFDHVHFPGAVPRSFLGPLLLAAPSTPALAVARTLLPLSSSDVQALVRGVLALATWLALLVFAHAVFRARTARAYFFWICAAEFHLVFWSTRTTPNGIAFPLVTAALAGVLGPWPRARLAGLAGLALIACTLRLEVLGLAAPAYLWAWLSGRVSFSRAVILGATSCALGAALSISVDSYFWSFVARDRLPGLGRYVWPEVSALFFNVVEGRSSEWGVAPWYTYWVTELPKLLAATHALLFTGLCSSAPGLSRAPLVFIAGFHVCLLSLLPHKEWRFILYTLPLWNAISAYGAIQQVRQLSATPARWFARLVPAMAIGLSLLLCMLYTFVSMHNYPGGAALQVAHTRLGDRSVHLHMDTLATMTGVSLFQSTHQTRPASSLVPSLEPRWVYDKTENLMPDADWCAFSHLLTEKEECRVAGDAPLFSQLGDPIEGLAGVRLKSISAYLRDLAQVPRESTLADAWRAVLPFVIHTKPVLYVCERTGC